MKKHNNRVIISFLVSVIFTIVFAYLLDFSDSDGLIHELRLPLSVMSGMIFNIALLLNFNFINRIPKVEELQKSINRQLESSQNIFETLKQEETKIKEIFLHLNSKDLLFKEFGTILINDYLNGFSLTKKGIDLTGEYWALQTYVKFWETICNEQVIRKAQKGDKPLIARITHSNNVDIWLESNSPYRQFSVTLYLLQQKFIEDGGVVVRMLIGPTPEPNEKYIQVIKTMEDIGIEVKYFCNNEVEESDYDFLYLDDEEMVLKWQSAQSGVRLAKCIVENFIDNRIKRSWDYLYYRCKEKGTPVISIPEDRQIRHRKK